MAFDLLETLGNVLNVLDLFASSSSSPGLNYVGKSAKKKKTKYFTEKISGSFISIAGVLFFFIFKDPLPAENYTQTLIVGSLIGTVLSGLLFFILHVMELYYFKNLFKLLLFSGSVLLFFISLALCIYFRSGLFI
jgi:hypothetical protein